MSFSTTSRKEALNCLPASGRFGSCCVSPSPLLPVVATITTSLLYVSVRTRQNLIASTLSAKYMHVNTHILYLLFAAGWWQMTCIFTKVGNPFMFVALRPYPPSLTLVFYILFL